MNRCPKCGHRWEAELGTLGTRRQREIVELLAALPRGRGVSYGRLADHFKTGKPNIWATVRILEDKGWVARRPGAYRGFSLTKEGRKAYENGA